MISNTDINYSVNYVKFSQVIVLLPFRILTSLSNLALAQHFLLPQVFSILFQIDFAIMLNKTLMCFHLWMRIVFLTCWELCFDGDAKARQKHKYMMCQMIGRKTMLETGRRWVINICWDDELWNPFYCGHWASGLAWASSSF